MPILKYKLAELSDSRIIAIEKATRRALILTPLPANGEQRLSGGGSLTARSGILLSVRQPANCTGYQIQTLPSGDAQVRRISVHGWDFTIKREKSSLSQPSATSRFAILDLLGGGLLLAQPSGLFNLTVTPAADGLYLTRRGFTVTVARGANGDPDYDYPEDFAP